MATREASILVTLRDRASSGLQRLGGVATSLSKAFGLVTAAATAVTAVVGVRFLGGAIREAGDFDEAMSKVGAVTQATGEELKGLRDAAREAGATTRFTATEAAAGLEELARSGQSAGEAIATLNPALQLAAGNNQTIAESAIQVTTALNAFGLAADQAGRVSDVYTRAAQRSAQTTGQLAEAMTQVAPVARQAGLSVEETSALIGRLADAGFRGGRGGTALRNALSQLQDPTSSFSRALQEAGIRSTNFLDVIEELARGGDRAQAAIRALGLEAAPAIQSLVAGGAPALRELTAELRNAEGASAEAAKALEDNLPGAIRNFRSALNDLKIQLAEPVTDRLKDGIFELAERIRGFKDSSTVERLGQLLKSAFDAAEAAVKRFVESVDFAAVQTKVEEFIEAARARFAEFSTGAQDLQRSFQVITGAVQTFVGVIGIAFNALATGIAGVLTASASVVQGYLTVLDTMTAGTIDAVGKARETITGINQSLQQSTIEFAERTRESFGTVQEGWANLANTAETTADRTEAAMERAGGAIEENLTATTDAAEAQLSRLQLKLLESGLSFEQLGLQGQAAGDRIEESATRAEGAAASLAEATGAAGQNIADLAESGSGAAESLGNVGDAAGAAADEIFRIEGTAGSLELVSNEAGRTSDAFNRLADAIQQAGSLSELDFLSDQISNLASQGQLTEAEIRQLIRAINEQAAAMDSASSSTARNTNAIRDLGGAAGSTAGSLDKLGRQARGASQGAKNLVQDMGAALSVWKDAGPDAARAVEDFVFQFNQIGLFTFEGARDRINRFVEGMERKFGPAEEAIAKYNQSLRDTDRSTRGLADSTNRLNTSTRSLSGATIKQELVVKFERDQGEQLILSEAQITRISERVLSMINADRDRTGGPG